MKRKALFPPGTWDPVADGIRMTGGLKCDKAWGCYSRFRRTKLSRARMAEMTGHIGASFNHQYLIARASREGSHILDYGCGRGETVALGLSRGLDVWGTEAYFSVYASSAEHQVEGAAHRVRALEGGRAPFVDGSFDAVISNQVLEHVVDPAPFFEDIHRLLRPGGALIIAFPVLETWFEGHVKLYFAHRIADSRQRRLYLNVCHQLGLGNYREITPRSEWIRQVEYALDETVFYRSKGELLALISRVFDNVPECQAADCMRARLGPKAAHLPPQLDPILRALFQLCAGQVLLVRKGARNDKIG